MLQTDLDVYPFIHIYMQVESNPVQHTMTENVNMFVVFRVVALASKTSTANMYIDIIYVLGRSEICDWDGAVPFSQCKPKT